MRFVRFILLAVLVAGTRALYADGLNCPADQQETLQAIGEGYLGNRESFSFFRCEFTFTEGSAATVADGLAGKLSNPVVSHGTWVVDGDVYRYELKCDEELLKKAYAEGSRQELSQPDSESGPKLVGVSLPCDPHGFVTNGKIQLRHGPAIQAANIRTSDLPLPGITITPFSAGIMGENDILNPGTLLTQGGQGSYRFAWLVPEADTSSSKYLKVAFGWGPDENGPIRRTMSLDPERGFLPVECETFYEPSDKLIEKFGRRISLLSFTKLLPASSGRWFPGRAVMIDHPDSHEARRTQIVEVTLLEADQRPAADDFKIAIPQGTAVSDPSDHRSGFKFSQARSVGPDDLEALLAESHEVLRRREQGIVMTKPERPVEYSKLLIINLVLLALASGWFLVKGRRRPGFNQKGLAE